jgi:hypothetical protein
MKRLLVAFAASAGLLAAMNCVQAQTAPVQNPFGGAAPQTPPASPAPKKPRTASTLKAGQFTTETEAKSSCPGDTVVWVNTSSKVYHHAGHSTYGKTKRGAYMCEKETAAAGFRPAKNEKS